MPNVSNTYGQPGSGPVSGGSSRSPSPLLPPARRRLRIVGSGTLFIAHTINVPGNAIHPGSNNAATNNLRAQSVIRTRGGSVATILSILCQFNNISSARVQASPRLGPSRLRSDTAPSNTSHNDAGQLLRPGSTNSQREPMVEAWLVAPMGRGSEASAILHDLEKEGVWTKLCARREGEGVPSAYVIKSVKEVRRDGSPRNGEGTSREHGGERPQTRLKTIRTIINYNPIPDLTHEEFIRCLTPLLYPVPASPNPSRSPMEDAQVAQDPLFDWLHFEGRTAQTTLSNMTGLDGFAKEREWRGRMVFSLDCTRPGRPGQEALIPHADVIFFSKAYARSLAYTSPRAFLLSQALRCAPHAILVVSWADQGSALLSIPTREYFQSSKFVVEPEDNGEFESIFSGTQHGDSFSISVEGSRSPGVGKSSWMSDGFNGSGTRRGNAGHIPKEQVLFDDEDEDDDDDVIDESGADDAFVAGMIYALSRRVLPHPIYSPSLASTNLKGVDAGDDLERGRWRLEECLRFATEMAGRKVRIKGFTGLARAMENVGWFED
ncbi:hypothetical protein FRB94_007611 [Tulasnella sp. JGI-2019a]|nr:hypothetical protein FRB94_007611 [Tulasnella sp. JGI-2019a]